MHPRLVPVLFCAAAALSSLGGAPGAAAQSLNVTQAGHLDSYTEYSDIWGWDGLDNSLQPVELAIVGEYTGTWFIDATVPSAPAQIAFIPGAHSIWRDIKTYGDYAYIVNETGNGLQIVDLTDPLAPVKVRDDSTFFSTSHNLYIDKDAARLYACGTNTPGMIILDLTDPVNPVQVGNFTTYYVHDVYVRNGIAYAACIYDGLFVTIDVSALPAVPILDSDYSIGVFTHNTWLTDDGNFCLTTDEITGGRVQVWDVSNPAAIAPVADIGDFQDPNLIVHNATVLGDLAYVSWYKRGLAVLDMADPYFPQHVGYYDTFPGGGTGYDGAWGVYPFAPSGTIYVSDISTGFYAFTFDPDYGHVGGFVTDAVSGDSLGGVTVTETAPTHAVETLADGRYGFSLTPEEYQITFERFGYEPDTVTVIVARDTTVVLDVALQPLASGSLSGVVREAGSYDLLPGIDLVLRGAPLGAQTGGAGDYAIANVPAGTYWLVTEEFGYAPDSVQVTIGNGEAVVQNLVLLPSFYVDDLETDLGWTVGGPGDAASTGIWERGDPVGTAAGTVQPEDDHTKDPGVIAFITGNTGGGVGDNDVDGGQTTLVSPVIDLSGIAAATLRVHTWFVNDAGANPGTDRFRIDVSDNGGSTWVNLLTTTASHAYWKPSLYPLQSYIGLTNAVRIRFIAEDIGGGSVVEAGVDDIDIFGDPTALGTGNPTARPVTVFPAAPNPFRAGTRLRFDLPERGPVRVGVYDVQGRRVAVLVDDVLDAGSHDAAWDGRDGDGREAASGIYFFRVQAGAGRSEQKVVLAR